MTNLKTVTKNISEKVIFLSQASSLGDKIHDQLEVAKRKIIRNTQAKVKESFTKNFKARPPRNKKEERTLAKFGRQAASSIADQSPIDSGDLRRSTTAEADGVGMRMNYAGYVEFGTSRMPPRPVFRLGIKDAEKSNNAIIQKELNEPLK